MNGIIVLVIVLVIASLAFLAGAFSFGYLFNKKKCCQSFDNFKKCFGNKVGSAKNFESTCCKDPDTWVNMNGLKDEDPSTNGYNKYCKK